MMKKHRTSRHSGTHGFSLLELSVVLGIIALIAASGMSMANGAIKSANRVVTIERLNVVKAALDSFAKTYGYLPCPANRLLTPSSTSYAVESRAAAACTTVAGGVILSGTTYIGQIPTRTLGLPDTYAADAWGDKLTYAVSNTQIAAVGSTTTNAGTITIRTGDRTTYFPITMTRTSMAGVNIGNYGDNTLYVGFPSPHNIPSKGVNVTLSGGSTYKGASGNTGYLNDATHIQIYWPPPSATPSVYSGNDTVTASWETPGAQAAYVVVSHGADGRGAYPVQASAIPSGKLCNTSATVGSSPDPCPSSATTACIDIENCNDDAIFYDTLFNNGTLPLSYFDDYIVWGSNANQRAQSYPSLYFTNSTGCSSTCETWCAKCTVNYPGGGAVVPPASITSGASLYKKLLTTNSTTCSATCFWSGNTATQYIKKP